MLIVAAIAGYGVCLAGCAGPAARYDHAARAGGLRPAQIHSGRYTHRLYWTRPPGPGEPLHVYLDGDGSPQRDRTRPNADPTPRRRVVLELMRADDAPAVLIGRPCYHGYAGEPGCAPEAWTSERYSRGTVASLATVVERLAQDHPASPATLIGFSGGGVLAMLIAHRVEVSAVVTIAANLDTDAWTRLHGLPPLRETDNPALLPPLRAGTRQLHLAGERDRQVPPSITRLATARQPGAVLRVEPGFDHDCCWTRIWPEVLATLRKQPASAPQEQFK